MLHQHDIFLHNLYAASLLFADYGLTKLL